MAVIFNVSVPSFSTWSDNGVSERIFPKSNVVEDNVKTGATLWAESVTVTVSLPRGSSLVIHNASVTMAVSARIKDISSPMDSPGMISVAISNALLDIAENWVCFCGETNLGAGCVLVLTAASAKRAGVFVWDFKS